MQKASENKGEFSYLKMVELLEQKKEKIKNIWHDRLTGASKSVDVWYKILSTRQLYQSKIDDMDTWIKFAKLALKRSKMVLCQDIVDMLKAEYQVKQREIPPALQLITWECDYMQKKNEKDVFESY